LQPALGGVMSTGDGGVGRCAAACVNAHGLCLMFSVGPAGGCRLAIGVEPLRYDVAPFMKTMVGGSLFVLDEHMNATNFEHL